MKTLGILKSPTARRRAAWLAVFVLPLVAATCGLGDLVKPNGPGKLAVSPGAVSDSAPAGSIGGRSQSIAITSDGASGIGWRAVVSHGSQWVTLGQTQDTAPATLTVMLKPSGLQPGMYQDTIVLTGDRTDDVVRVPVSFAIKSCISTTLTPGKPVNDALGDNSCGAPHRSGRKSQLFTFTGAAGDSVSLSLTSSGFDAYLVLDTALTKASVAENDNCYSGQKNACLRYYRLPRTTAYTVEATTAGAGETGAFRLLLSRPTPPAVPLELSQLNADSSSTIPVGGTSTEGTVVYRAQLSDPDDLEYIQLEVEVKPIGTAFNGNGIIRGSGVSSGALGYIRDGVGQGTNYHWRARAIDETGRTTDWVSYGGNAEDAPDFLAGPQRPPEDPSNLAQFRIDGTTSIGVGGLTTEQTVVLRARLTDPDATDMLKLDVEVRPIGIPFSNVPTTSSVAVGNGATASASATGLTDYTSYHWQARTSDRAGATSGWVAFGGNPESQADFGVVLPPARLIFLTQPSTTTGGTPISPAVRIAVQDAGGSTLSYFNGNITLAISANPSAGVLSGTTTVAAVNGIATFGDLRIDRSGTGYTLAASSVGLPGVASTAFDVLPGAATRLVFTVQPSNVSADAPIAPAIRVSALDAAGNLASSFGGAVTIGIGTNPAGGVLAGTTSVVAAAGVATFTNLTINRTGAGYTLQAAAGGLTGATSTAFNVSGGAASATQSTVAVSPASIVASSGSAFAGITVTVRDASGNPLPGAAVVVSATGTGNTLTPASGTTNTSGVFTATISSTVAGPKTISATGGGTAIAQTGTLTVTPAAASQLAFTVQPTSVATGAAIAPPIQVTARDAFGNTATAFVGSVTVALGANPGGGALAGTLTAAASSGVATFSNLAIDRPGTGYTLQAGSSGVPSATSAAFNVTGAPPGP